MHGIVNKAIKGLILENYGEDVWEQIKSQSGVDIDIFLSNEPYDDAITYKLATGASEVLGTSVSNILVAFGEYWILKTGMKSYGSLMESGGNNLKEFLTNLPNFHSRVMLMFPDLQPPEFRISDHEETGLKVHYYSDRSGLQDFVQGLLQGLGKMFETPVQVALLESRDDGHDHEVFAVNW